jgi:HSP20 family molecular chaperone IbpA
LESLNRNLLKYFRFILIWFYNLFFYRILKNKEEKMKKINMFITLMIGSSLAVHADMHLEENMYAPARDMMAMDAAMNKIIEEKRQQNKENPIVFKDDKSFHEAPVAEFVEHNNSYVLEQVIEDDGQTKVEVTLVGNMLNIKSTTTTKDSMTTGSSSSSSSYVSISTQSMSIPSDSDAEGMEHHYQNGIVKVTLPKKKNQFRN